MADMINGLLGNIRDPRVSQGLLALGSQMMTAGSQGAPMGAAVGQGYQAYQQAYRSADEYAREQKVRELREKAVSQITDADLQLLAQIDPSGQAIAQVLAARMKPQAPPQPTDDQREYLQYAQEEQAAGRAPLPFIGYMERIKRAAAPSTQVSLNTGQKGFENEIKLRSDFRSEPIYKAYQDTISAHSQIVSAIKAGTPAGDLAAATKLMKILDPSSVVRESELGMAMSATGLADRLQNYAQMTLNGQKLTPQQRSEFMALADNLKAVAEEQYNAKASEYESIATDYGFSPYRVTGRKGGHQGQRPPLSFFGG